MLRNTAHCNLLEPLKGQEKTLEFPRDLFREVLKGFRRFKNTSSYRVYTEPANNHFVPDWTVDLVFLYELDMHNGIVVDNKQVC